MITVEGIIIPASWDDQGNVLDLAIATRCEEEYLLANDDYIFGLKSPLRQEVIVKGHLQTQQERKIIQVERFRKLKN